MKAKVRQLISNNSGNPIANQFEIWTDKGKYFQSYNSTIVFIDKKGKVFLDEYYWDYSKTTGKYRNQFLGEYKNETEKKIKSKEYKLINLN
tara:strand:- start:251 stop:523 length:273 start_codon:yes stop_codon:yes gene_type:complete